jgi:hypothetical protein
MLVAGRDVKLMVSSIVVGCNMMDLNTGLMHSFDDEAVALVHLTDGGLAFEDLQLSVAKVEFALDLVFVSQAPVAQIRIPHSANSVLTEVV